MTTHNIPDHTCPHCGVLHDSASEIVDGEGPSAGDCSMCIECGEFYIFNDDLSGRKPTVDEYIAIGSNEEASMIRRAWMITAAEKK